MITGEAMVSEINQVTSASLLLDFVVLSITFKSGGRTENSMQKNNRFFLKS
jgi:hypothetical protein